MIASSLSKGLNTIGHNMLFSSKLQGLCPCLCISLPLYDLRTPVSQNLFDMLVPTTAKTLTPFTPRSSFFFRTTCTVCYNGKKSLNWNDPELQKIFPAFFGTRKHFTFEFDVWLTVHRSSVWNKKPTRCHLVLYLFLFISCSTCFGLPCAYPQELTT